MSRAIPLPGRHVLLPLLWLLTFALAALFAWRTPAWQAPDEPAHYAYVATVARTGLPPVLAPACYNEAYKNALVGSNFAQPVDFARFCYEGHQPPLFYYLAAPVFLASGGSLLALRLLCAAIGAFVPIAAWAIARAAGADRALALATALLVALVPQHLAMLGALNNDALTFLVVALALRQLLQAQSRERRAQSEGWPGWRLGILLGLCLLTKTLAWVVLPVALLALALPERSNVKSQTSTGASTLSLKPRWKIRNQKSKIKTLSLAFLLVLPWLGRNSLTYGGLDVMALGRHGVIAVGQPRTAAEVAQRGVAGTLANGAVTTFHSFWGQFGWMKAPLQSGEYRVLTGICILAALGLAGWTGRRGWHVWGLDRHALGLLAAWVAVNTALFVYYNLEFVQYQGRYLFPSLSALALFLMVGLGAWFPARLRPLPWAALLVFLLYLDALAILQRLPGMMHY